MGRKFYRRTWETSIQAGGSRMRPGFPPTFFAPPTAYRLLVQQPLGRYRFPALRHTTGAGEPVNPELLQYLNRLSSLLFTLAVWLQRNEGAMQEHPTYRR